MKNTMTIKTIIFLCMILIASILAFFMYKEIQIEPFNQCPTSLMKEGNALLLYNPSLAKVPGVNPIKFNSLDDYEKYIKWQRANNVDCPVLHLDKVFDEHSKMYSIESVGSNQSNGIFNQIGLNDNLNLGQNLNSNYEYNYYTSKLDELHTLPTVPYTLSVSPTISDLDSNLMPRKISESDTLLGGISTITEPQSEPEASTDLYGLTGSSGLSPLSELKSNFGPKEIPPGPPGPPGPPAYRGYTGYAGFKD
jgi:hypothetical protein